MKKDRFIDITKIRDFFDLILTSKNASREEVHNFLHACLKFVFDYNKLDINMFKIQFHAVKSFEDPNFEACMQQHNTHPNWFDVYFNYNDLVVKDVSQDSLRRLFSLMLAAMHEFGHIIQYVLHKNHMNKLETREDDVEYKKQKFLKTCNKKKQNLVIRQFKRHEQAKMFISNVERNADYQAHKYLKMIFNSLIDIEDNAISLAFLEEGLTFINKTHQLEYYCYRIADKTNRQAIKILKKNGVKEEDLLKQ